MFADLLHKQKSKLQVQNLLEGLLTPKERQEIERRIKVVELLKANMPQQQIATKLNVGIATVTRGSRELQQGFFKQIKPGINFWRG